MGKDSRNAAKTERAWLRREAERRARKAKDKAKDDGRDTPTPQGYAIEKLASGLPNGFVGPNREKEGPVGLSV